MGASPGQGRCLRWLSETYDAAESVPTQLERGAVHAARLAAWFKDDGYSGFKEITRDGFADPIIISVSSGGPTRQKFLVMPISVVFCRFLGAGGVVRVVR